MPLESNVCIKSNVFTRQKETTVWQDRDFLKKINDAVLLAEYEDEFKKGDPGRNIKEYFSEEQLELSRFSGACTCAPQGVKTFGFTQGPDGKEIIVCRCPYASIDQKHLCKGYTQWDSCHKIFKPVEYKDPDIPSGKEVLPPPSKSVTPPPPSRPKPTNPPPTPVTKKDSVEKDTRPKTRETHNVVFPDSLFISCNGYDIKGEKVIDGYEVRITSGGVFIANINSHGIVVGKHPSLKIESQQKSNEEISLIFNNSEKLNIRTQQKEPSIVDIDIGYTKISVCVK